MDEINALIPGCCTFQLVEEKGKWVTKTIFDKENPEHLMALDYAKALEAAMTKGMQDTFDIVKSRIPAGSSCEVSLYWLH